MEENDDDERDEQEAEDNENNEEEEEEEEEVVEEEEQGAGEGLISLMISNISHNSSTTPCILTHTEGRGREEGRAQGQDTLQRERKGGLSTKELGVREREKDIIRRRNRRRRRMCRLCIKKREMWVKSGERFDIRTIIKKERRREYDNGQRFMDIISVEVRTEELSREEE